MIDYYETKAHPITKKMVLEAYKEIKLNGNAAGVDGISLEGYAKNLPQNLYKLWNRLTSGSYFPSPVREKLIPKGGGESRGLGINTVDDRIAQQVVRTFLEPRVEGSFHDDSFGFRRGRNQHQAMQQVLNRCKRFGWVIDLDIRKFFDTIDHELLMKGLRKYTNEKWVTLYVERWLKVGILKEDGALVTRETGSVQGAVISPLLSNIFLHFVFDKWMELNFPEIPFERYCDDIIVHCVSEKQALFVRNRIASRLAECKLSLNSEKTCIVYCKNTYRRDTYRKYSFDFLGYTFRPKWCHTKKGNMLCFMPVMSTKAKKRVWDKIKGMRIRQQKGPIQILAQAFNPKIRGWLNYYCKFSKWSTQDLWFRLNIKLTRWVMNLRKIGQRKAHHWLKGIYRTQPGLFAHWGISHP